MGSQLSAQKDFSFFSFIFALFAFLLCCGGGGVILSRKSGGGVINDGWGGGWRDGLGGREEMFVSGKGLTRPFSFCQNPK